MAQGKLSTGQLFDLLDKTSAELLEIISYYNEDEINVVLAKGSWTVAQVIEHVTKSNKGVAQGLEMEGKIAKRSLTEREPEMKDLFLNFTIKLKSPDFILPTKSFYEKESLVADLKKSIVRLENFRTKVNLSEMMILPGLGKITKLEILYFVLYHTQRHIHQIKNIFQILKSKAMKAVNPYLNFNGNTEEAFNFYKSVFGGEFRMIMRMKDAQGMPVPEGQEEKIMHIALPLNSGQVLMASDNCDDTTFKEGNNFYISLHADSVEEGQKLYDALAADGKADHPFKKEFWGDWHGNLTDKFGINWMVNYSENQQ